MPIKSRYPNKDFSHRPYLNWLKRVYAWLMTQVGESDYPAHEVGDLPGLIDALENAINSWEALKGVASDRSKIYTDVAGLIEKQLRLLRNIIPTVVDPHVMGSFGLEDDIPGGRDELGGVAEVCINHWNEVIGGGVPPEYAPLEPHFDSLITLFGDFENARDNYYSSFNLAQQAQNNVLTAREACHAKERDIFNWYNGFHSDSEAEWWTGTEWGTSSGGGGEPPEPELPVFPNPPEIFTLSIRADGTIEVVWTGVEGATHMLLEKRKQGMVEWSLVMNGLPADPAEILPYIDPYISPGIWEYRMIPMNGDEHGEAKIAVIEVP